MTGPGPSTAPSIKTGRGGRPVFDDCGGSAPPPTGALLCFGEVLLRLSPPGRELLLQSPRLDVWIGGAEANVATQLASLDHRVAMATRLPDDDLGRAAARTLRGHGVDTGAIHYGGDRIGLYFATSGAGLRATEVVYDRAHSSFAETPAEAWDWEGLLTGVDHLHLSGITPALGPVPARFAQAAVEAATARGIVISFDGNWRGRLWARWDSDPRAILTGLVEHADILFGDHRDISLLLGRDPADWSDDQRRDASDAAFAAFPRLRAVASTTREIEHVDLHRLSARLDTRKGEARTGIVEIAGVVDRIGGGDAFAAGVLHAMRSGGDIVDAAQDGLALAVLKHSLPGDAGLFRRHDLKAFRDGGLDVRR